jgi:hypothetical protein
VPAGSLPSFLRQHYTTSPEMAGVLASFLVSNGAADTRYTGGQPKGSKDGAKEAKQEAKPNGPPDQLDRFGRRLRPAPTAPETAKPDAEQQQAARPDANGAPPQADLTRPGHNKRPARPEEAPEVTRPEGQLPAQAETDRRPDGRKLSAKQRASRRGTPSVEEPPKAEEPPVGEPPRSDTASKDESRPSTDPKSEPATPESANVEAAKETAKEAAKDSGEPLTTPSDPVPPVTPAPSTTAAIASKPEAAGAPPEPASQPPPPTVTASTPQLPPVAPAGPPAPPISQ